MFDVVHRTVYWRLGIKDYNLMDAEMKCNYFVFGTYLTLYLRVLCRHVTLRAETVSQG